MAALTDDQKQLDKFMSDVIAPRLIALNESSTVLIAEYKKMSETYPWMFIIACREEMDRTKAQLLAQNEKRKLIIDQCFSIRRELGIETGDTWDTHKVDVNFYLWLSRRSICAADAEDLEALRTEYAK